MEHHCFKGEPLQEHSGSPKNGFQNPFQENKMHQKTFYKEDILGFRDKRFSLADINYNFYTSQSINMLSKEHLK